MASEVATFIRTHKHEIVGDWARTVGLRLVELAELPAEDLVDHLPDMLDGLSDWIEGRTGTAELALAQLAQGHVVQRIDSGFEPEVIDVEYSLLRQVVLNHLLAVPSSDAVRRELILCNSGLDRAVIAAARCCRDDRHVGLATPEDAAGDSAASALQTSLLEYLRRRSGDETLDVSTTLFSDGTIDSVGMIDLISFLESETQCEIRQEDVTLDNFDTVARILAFVDDANRGG